jgi:hypothetical protein
MAGITALGTTYTLPNYTGILYQLTPNDTAFFSAIGGLSGGGGQVTDTEFEWQTFDLRDAGQNTVLEGQDAPTDQNRVRANATNITQIHQETVGVSYTKQAATGRLSGLATQGSTNPVVAELDWQTEQMLKQMVRDANFSLLRGTYQKPSDNTTARKTRGLLSAIATNVIDVGAAAGQTGTAAATTDLITLAAHGLVAGDQIVVTASAATPIVVGNTYYVLASGLTANDFKVSAVKNGAALDITANGSVTWTKVTVTLTKTHIDDACQLAYENGGLMEGETATLLGGPGQRRAVTAAYTAAGYVTKELAGNVGGVRVTRIETDFGILNVMTDRLMPASQLAVVSLEQCRPVYTEIPGKGHFFAEPLAKTGAKDRVQLYGEVGLAYGNERAHAKIVNLKG